MISEGILSAVGSTPLIRLRRLLPEARFELYAKLEGFNPGGSIKDRPAVAILAEGLSNGTIDSSTVIVESSSGNMGIGLAQGCRYHGLRFLCVVDRNTTQQNIRVLEAYGAEVVRVTEPDPETGELLTARIKRVEALCREIPNSFWPNQYANLSNSGSHYRTTMREIATALEDRVDFLFLATSTCGTLRGCGDYIRDHGLPTRLIAVDARGSKIFSDEKAKRSIPGIGAGIRPPLCDLGLVDRCIHVNDLECVNGCRMLVNREAILAGGSSGAVVAALLRMQIDIPDGASCVAIFPDRGERYLDTVYSEDWVRERCSAVGPVWTSSEDLQWLTPAS
jgi:N-(2-amino-2-carboxyethyl)-L-glutamate synthase